MPPPEQRTFQLVVAAGRAWGIGVAGGLPWRLPGDLAHFARLTRDARAGASNAVVMGRATWESLPPKARPLPGRLNVVLSRSAGGGEADENGRPAANGGGVRAPLALPDGVLCCPSLEAALATLAAPAHAQSVERVFVIGGAQVYRVALASPACTAVHLTRVDCDAPCDTFMPALDPAAWRLWSAAPARREGGVRYVFETYVRGPGLPPDGLPSAAPPHAETQAGGGA